MIDDVVRCIASVFGVEGSVLFVRARIQVASLNSRLKDKKRRLEAISFRRDAIRTEYQVCFSQIK